MKIVKTRRSIVLIASVSLIALGSVAAADRIDIEPVKGPIRDWVRHNERPRLEWPSVDAEAVGLDASALDDLRDDLARWDTGAFLVVRNGSIAYEWYRDDSGPNQWWGGAAVAKGLTASLLLALAIEQDAIDLDDEVCRYVSEWCPDPVRARIRVRHLAFHASGVADVDFLKGIRDELDGWELEYYENPADRFDMALQGAPIRFEPGARYEYSGVGYYVLANVLSRALGERGHPDLRVLLRDRIMRPLRVPDGSWQISYGTSYQVGDRTLYALGSGARYTPRTAARIAYMVMNHGQWADRGILDPEALTLLLDADAVPDHSPHPERIVAPWDTPGAPAAGWYLNSEGVWPSLPADAFVALGSSHEIVLAVPSWDLVAVRLGGGTLGGADAPFASALESRFFAPLAQAVVGTSGTPGS